MDKEEMEKEKQLIISKCSDFISNRSRVRIEQGFFDLLFNRRNENTLINRLINNLDSSKLAKLVKIEGKAYISIIDYENRYKEIEKVIRTYEDSNSFIRSFNDTFVYEESDKIRKIYKPMKFMNEFILKKEEFFEQKVIDEFVQILNGEYVDKDIGIRINDFEHIKSGYIKDFEENGLKSCMSLCNIVESQLECTREEEKEEKREEIEKREKIFLEECLKVYENHNLLTLWKNGKMMCRAILFNAKIADDYLDVSSHKDIKVLGRIYSIEQKYLENIYKYCRDNNIIFHRYNSISSDLFEHEKYKNKYIWIENEADIIPDKVSKEHCFYFPYMDNFSLWNKDDLGKIFHNCCAIIPYAYELQSGFAGGGTATIQSIKYCEKHKVFHRTATCAYCEREKEIEREKIKLVAEKQEDFAKTITSIEQLTFTNTFEIRTTRRS
jgi:hypothetical protein